MRLPLRLASPLRMAGELAQDIISRILLQAGPICSSFSLPFLFTSVSPHRPHRPLSHHVWISFERGVWGREVHASEVRVG